ncbi:MAG: RDD family protein [Betaproteobacteria bacterium]|nr:RDD family protein [Betaproteobacteria bacterium]
MSEIPSIRRRLVCNLYESLLLTAFVFLVSIPLVVLSQELAPLVARWLLRGYVLGMAGLYFVTFWGRGQTLAMKTWRIRLESSGAAAVSRKQLWLRYLLACLNLATLGAGWWYAAFTPERQFLQDRWAGTRLVRI